MHQSGNASHRTARRAHGWLGYLDGNIRGPDSESKFNYPYSDFAVSVRLPVKQWTAIRARMWQRSQPAFDWPPLDGGDLPVGDARAGKGARKAAGLQTLQGMRVP